MSSSGSTAWVYEDYIPFQVHLKAKHHRIRNDYFARILGEIFDFVDPERKLDQSKFSHLTVNTLQAKTSLLENDGNYALIFDIHHGCLLKQFYQLIISGTSQDHLFLFLKDFVASRVLEIGNSKLALALQDEKLSRLYGIGQYDQESMFQTAILFYQKIPKMPFHEISSFLDLYIMAHEVFHYVERQNIQASQSYKNSGKDAFEIVYKKYYEEGKFPFYDKVIDGVKDIEKKKLQWEQERSVFSEMAENLQSELSCDLFAIAITSRIILRNLEEGKINWKYEDVFSSLCMITHCHFYLNLLTEQATKFGQNLNFWEDLEHTRVMRLRATAIMEFFDATMFQYTFLPRNRKRFDLTEERLVSPTAIADAVKGVSAYFRWFIDEPLKFPLTLCLYAAKAKLTDEVVDDVYDWTANNWSISDKAWYVGPAIEKFTQLDYFESLY